MNDRIHRYLDGELSRDGLAPQDLVELEAYQEVLRETATAHRSLEAPDLTGAVMARLPPEAPERVWDREALTEEPARETPPTLRRALGWLWTPRPLRLRPAWGMLAAAVLALLVALPSGEPVPSATTSEVQTTARMVFVQFRLDAPQASAVHLAGTFTEWEPDYTLHQTAPGVWAILVPLEPGVHDYAFVVDGSEWVADPAAPWVEDGFGGVNSRLSVLLPNGLSES